ncbi:MAG: AMP-binding protein [Acidobacteria bacterium]|nr:AMP-binding protein [Acidobacteriota bacterium]
MDPVATHAEQRPDEPAVIQGDRQLTWRQLDERANRIARALRRRGVGPGDRVAVSLKNSIEFFELLAGAGRLGATVVPVSYRFKRDEVEYMVEDSVAKVVIAEPENAEAVAGFDDVVFRGDAYEAWVAGEDGAPLDDQPGETLAALRFYTSGTTGRPKAIVRSSTPNEALDRAHVAALAGRLGPVLGPGEVHLVAGVTYHAAPGAYASMALSSGHTLVVMDHFDPLEGLRLIERHRVTWSQMAPIHFVRILSVPDDVRASVDVSSVKRILHAGAPCPPDVKWKILELFPEGSVYEYYAATEGYATECPSEDWIKKPGTVGRPPDGVELFVLDDDGNQVGPSEVGQVFVRIGGQRSFEYEGAPEKTAETWRGDMFSVGDMGFIDEDGYLFLTDRKTHMIISGGANIYPAEVENVLFGHPAVADACVIGVPDDEFGEQVKALVEVRSPVSEAELIEFCRDRLSHYKCPKSVDFLTTMPRDPNGKIRKRELRDPYWAGRTAKI